MKSLKVVFLGTPEFAKTSLEAIHQSHHHVVGVVTVADKASGRGQKIHQSPVKVYASENNIPVFQPEKLRNPEFLEELRKLEADVFVVVAFRMMPKVLFEMPAMGTFNLHASLLPDYRGAAPINYAVINGEEKPEQPHSLSMKKLTKEISSFRKNCQYYRTKTQEAFMTD